LEFHRARIVVFQGFEQAAAPQVQEALVGECWFGVGHNDSMAAGCGQWVAQEVMERMHVGFTSEAAICECCFQQ